MIPYRLLSIASCLIFVGCGYQFRVEGPGPTIGTAASAELQTGAVPRLYIPNFENGSLEPNLELKYTTYAQQEFSAGSGAKVVNEHAQADLVLKGSIVSVILPSLTFNQTQTFERRVIVRVSAVVEDLRTGEVAWKQDASAASEFFISNDLQFNRVLQDRALEQAGRLIAEDLATRFLLHLQRRASGKATGSPAGQSRGQAEPQDSLRRLADPVPP